MATPRHSSQTGNTLVEYAVIIALLLMFVLGSISLLGGSLNGLFGGTTNVLASNGAGGVSAGSASESNAWDNRPGSQNGGWHFSNFFGGFGSGGNAGSSGTNGSHSGGSGDTNGSVTSGNGQSTSGDPQAGDNPQPSGATSAASAEGATHTSGGSPILPGQPIPSADQITQSLTAMDGKIIRSADKEWLQQLSRIMYYMAGAQGHFENVDQLTVGGVDANGKPLYTEGDALRDLNIYRWQLCQALANPPDGFPADQLLQIKMAGQAVFDKASNELDPYLSSAKNNQPKQQFNFTQKSYKEMVNYTQLKENVNQAYWQDANQSKEVFDTLKIATTLEKLSSDNPQP